MLQLVAVDERNHDAVTQLHVTVNSSAYFYFCIFPIKIKGNISSFYF